jgi:hypothetical protein
VGAAISASRIGATPGNVWLFYDRPIDDAALPALVESFAPDRVLAREDTIDGAVVDRFDRWQSLDVRSSAHHFGPAITLAATGISPKARPGGDVFVELRWQASQTVPVDYTVFAHLVDPSGNKVAQHDTTPGAGQRPTTGWRSGETIVDRIALPVPSDARPGTYQVLVGLYRGSERLPVDGTDAVTLGPVEVGRS